MTFHLDIILSRLRIKTGYTARRRGILRNMILWILLARKVFNSFEFAPKLVVIIISSDIDHISHH